MCAVCTYVPRYIIYYRLWKQYGAWWHTYLLCKVRVTDLAIPLCFSDHHHQHPWTVVPSPKYIYKKVVHYCLVQSFLKNKEIFFCTQTMTILTHLVFPSRTGSESLPARYILCYDFTHLRNKKFLLKFLSQQNASKFAMFYI